MVQPLFKVPKKKKNTNKWPNMTYILWYKPLNNVIITKRFYEFIKDFIKHKYNTSHRE